MALAEAGVLDRHGVQLIGASIAAIKVAEDRLKFKDAMRSIDVAVPDSVYARSIEQALEAADKLGFPLIIRPSFTLGGVGGGIAYNIEEFRELAERGLGLSPVHEILVEESVIGWKEFELEVMRDGADNFVVICSIENIDPMGVHTGDSITVAPALTLTDKEYQRMRDAARRIIRRVGVETGGSNIQFAINPDDGRMVAIEMNPRVSRSSALASKATGFPIAKIAAKLALGYRLDEIPNDITRLTPASFEPTIDYVVVKVPRWAFEKFPQADRTLTTQMKSVGEAMAIGRTFKEAFLKAFRSLELGSNSQIIGQTGAAEDDVALQQALGIPTDRRMWAVFRALARGWSIEEIHRLTRIDRWFLTQFQQLVELGRSAEAVGPRDLSDGLLRELKRAGFADADIGRLVGLDEDSVRARRLEAGIVPAYKRIDTCAAEFESFTPYMYGTFERECEAEPTAPQQGRHSRQRPEPHRPGDRVRLLLLSRGVRAARRGLRDGDGQLQSGDRLDRLRHGGPAVLRAADVRGRDGHHRAREDRRGRRRVRRAVRRPDAAQARAAPAGGRRAHSRHVARFDRPRRGSRAFLEAALGARHPAGAGRHRHVRRRGPRRGDRRSGSRWSSVRRTCSAAARWRSCTTRPRSTATCGTRCRPPPEHPILIDKFLEDATEIDVDALADASGAVVIGGIMEHIEQAGIHSGDSSCVVPPFKLDARHLATIRDYTRRIARALDVVGLMNAQFAIKDDVVYVLEVNPRASRTVPYLSKATGVPLAKVAARLMIGRTLADEGLADELHVPGYFVKTPVFPFVRFPGVDTLLGPEMKSTGEVMGGADTFGSAFAKAYMGAGQQLPQGGTAFISVNNQDKAERAADRAGAGGARVFDRRHARHGRVPARARPRGRHRLQGERRAAARRRRAAQPAHRARHQHAARPRVVLRRPHRAQHRHDAGRAVHHDAHRRGGGRRRHRRPQVRGPQREVAAGVPRRSGRARHGPAGRPGLNVRRAGRSRPVSTWS